jgi:hypothetical protein
MTEFYNENFLLMKKDELIGKIVWEVSCSIGSMVFLILDPKFQSRDLPFGNEHFHLCLCMWRLETRNQVIVASQDERNKIASSLNVLVGKQITSVELSNPSMDITITFDKELQLRTFACYSDDDAELWRVRFSDGNHLSAFINGRFEFRS